MDAVERSRLPPEAQATEAVRVRRRRKSAAGVPSRVGAGKRNSFFYFNGFNSAILDDFSGNGKIVAVSGFAESRGLEFVPVSVNYRRASEQSREILDSIEGAESRIVFAGSSMGGWFARIMQLLLLRSRPGLRVEALAFNPAFDISENHGLLLGPQVNHVTGESYVWTEAHGERLVALENTVDYDQRAPFFVYVDKGDEVIPWPLSAGRHDPISRFVAFDGGCHSFEHYREALEDFDELTAVRAFKSL